jgi:hypothetical protein
MDGSFGRPEFDLRANVAGVHPDSQKSVIAYASA